ncbi:C40 family peptidase [Fervidobacterium thailandense]|uniref:C40 family peptidase n=1 Tax=Fervidobacterium thailandense TaxID=1008305 RepID=UPI000B2B8EB6|nr:C40 family peptidase [Fervidobacterium thailandense]
MNLGYGMVICTVADVRKEPKFRSERIHQLVFGEVVEILEEDRGGDYVFVRDFRIDYSGYVNKNQLLKIDSETYTKYVLSKRFVKIKMPFCRTSGAIEYMLPVGSRLLCDGDGFVLPDGRYFTLLDDPSPEIDGIVELSKKFLGVPYLWGGTSSYGFDCSGFTNRMYDLFNVNLPRDSTKQEEFCEKVQEPLPGDLLFMPDHVMIYIGEDSVIHANGHGMCVEITNLLKDDYGRYLASKITKIGRPKMEA